MQRPAKPPTRVQIPVPAYWRHIAFLTSFPVFLLMNIKEADVSDAENLVDELWIPLAKEMEEVSEFNTLAESGVRSDAVKYFTDRLR
jgi:hypothetical protein